MLMMQMLKKVLESGRFRMEQRIRGAPEAIHRVRIIPQTARVSDSTKRPATASDAAPFFAASQGLARWLT
jgi:hypothetical protein